MPAVLPDERGGRPGRGPGAARRAATATASTSSASRRRPCTPRRERLAGIEEALAAAGTGWPACSTAPGGRSSAYDDGRHALLAARAARRPR